MGLSFKFTTSIAGLVVLCTGIMSWPLRGSTAIALPPIAHPSSTASAQPISAKRRAYLVRLAQRFTVKVKTPDNQGSGVIVKHQSGTYAVITNEHVVLDHSQIEIETYDGRKYAASPQPDSAPHSLDIKLLSFKSPRFWYPVAMLKPGLALPKGSPVIAAGYPHRVQGNSFQATDGAISYITSKGLNGGYRIGYSNTVPKGMSGGPVLNAVGQVVAINGLHSEPLWGNPYTWDDGTIPSERLFSIFSTLSWAIPIETVIHSLSNRSNP